MELIRIAIAEDNSVIRNVLQKYLNEQLNIVVVNAAENGQILLENLYVQGADLVILDVNMPVMDGFETIKQLKNNFPELKVIVFSSDLNKNVITYFEQYDVSHFLPKESRLSQITETILEVGQLQIVQCVA